VGHTLAATIVEAVIIIEKKSKEHVTRTIEDCVLVLAVVGQQGWYYLLARSRIS
jgi:hypothetical protein